MEAACGWHVQSHQMIDISEKKQIHQKFDDHGSCNAAALF